MSMKEGDKRIPEQEQRRRLDSEKRFRLVCYMVGIFYD